MQKRIVLLLAAAALLHADECPSGTMDVVIDAEQMQLQVHESVGHPTELDRIYGTEAAYAGTSFLHAGDLGSLADRFYVLPAAMKSDRLAAASASLDRQDWLGTSVSVSRFRLGRRFVARGELDKART